MISQARLHAMNLKNLDDYFEYILDQRKKGEYDYMRKLMEMLSGRQKRDAIEYYLDKTVEEEDRHEKTILVKQVKDLIIML